MKINRLIAAGMMLFLITGSLRAWPVDELGETSGLRNRRGNEGPQRDPQLSMPLFSGESSNSLYQSSSEETPIDLSQEGLSQQFELACFAKADWEQQSQNPTMSSVEEAQRAVSFWNEQRERYQMAAGNVEAPELLGRLEGLETVCNEAAEAAGRVVASQTISVWQQKTFENEMTKHHALHAPDVAAMKWLQQKHRESFESIRLAELDRVAQEGNEIAVRKKIEKERHDDHHHEEAWELGFIIAHVVQGGVYCVVHFVAPRFIQHGDALAPTLELIVEGLHHTHALTPAAMGFVEGCFLTKKERQEFQLHMAAKAAEQAKATVRNLYCDHHLLRTRLEEQEDFMLQKLAQKMSRFFSLIQPQGHWNEVEWAGWSQQVALSQELVPLVRQDVSIFKNRFIANCRAELQRKEAQKGQRILPLKAKYEALKKVFEKLNREKDFVSTQLEKTKADKIFYERLLEARTAGNHLHHEIDQCAVDCAWYQARIHGREDGIKTLTDRLNQLHEKQQQQEWKMVEASFYVGRVEEKFRWPLKLESKMLEIAEAASSPDTTPQVQEAQAPLFHHALLPFKTHWAACDEALKLFYQNKTKRSAKQVKAELGNFLMSLFHVDINIENSHDPFVAALVRQHGIDKWVNILGHQIKKEMEWRFPLVSQDCKDAYFHMIKAIHETSFLMTQYTNSNWYNTALDARDGLVTGFLFAAAPSEIVGAICGGCMFGPVGILAGVAIGGALGSSFGAVAGAVIVPVKNAVEQPRFNPQVAATAARVAAEKSAGTRFEQEAAWASNRAQEIADFADQIKRLYSSSSNGAGGH